MACPPVAVGLERLVRWNLGEREEHAVRRGLTQMLVAQILDDADDLDVEARLVSREPPADRA